MSACIRAQGVSCPRPPHLVGFPGVLRRPILFEHVPDLVAGYRRAAIISRGFPFHRHRAGFFCAHRCCGRTGWWPYLGCRLARPSQHGGAGPYSFAVTVFRDYGQFIPDAVGQVRHSSLPVVRTHFTLVLVGPPSCIHRLRTGLRRGQAVNDQVTVCFWPALRHVPPHGHRSVRLPDYADIHRSGRFLGLVGLRGRPGRREHRSGRDGQENRRLVEPDRARRGEWLCR